MHKLSTLAVLAIIMATIGGALIATCLDHTFSRVATSLHTAATVQQ